MQLRNSIQAFPAVPTAWNGHENHSGYILEGFLRLAIFTSLVPGAEQAMKLDRDANLVKARADHFDIRVAPGNRGAGCATACQH